MVLCDTNILISVFSGRKDTIEQLDKIGTNNIILSAVTVMELYQGMTNKKELLAMKKNIRFYDVLEIDERISEKAVQLMDLYNLSHNLQIPDAIIGASAIIYQFDFYTYNLKDFQFMPNIKLYQLQ
jgi:hypothetical protein